MSDLSLPSDLQLSASTQQQSWRARLQLEFEKRGGDCVLARRAHTGPLIVQKPLYPEGRGICHAIIVHPPGGIAGGDDLDMAISIGSQAHALITTPGAAKWYRSQGPQSRQQAHLRVATDGVLEWLPQENILFNAANAAIRTRIELEKRARAIGWDIVCLGRTASSERFERGHFKQDVDLHIDGRLVWTERAAMSGGDPLLRSMPGLNGHTVFGTLWFAGMHPDRSLLDALRAQTFAAGVAGATALPDVTLVRAVAHSSEALKNYFIGLWQIARPHWLGIDAQRPRIWAT
ncbi:MAG TPA: urease accessory protein UreD [Rhodocyclaceae bacterium]|nr:urease accessory protein UreD [Rhodocyclaceae bacterium]